MSKKKNLQTKKRGRPTKADAQAAMGLWIEAADMAIAAKRDDLFDQYAPPRGANPTTIAVCAMNLKEALKNAERHSETGN